MKNTGRKNSSKKQNRNNKAGRGGNKLRTYRKFKDKFYPEKYISSILKTLQSEGQ